MMNDLESKKDMSIDFNGKLLFWIVMSIIFAIIFARNSNGLCEYLFLTISYIFIVYIITSVWHKFEINPTEQTIISSAALGGWLIGTFVIWRSKGKNRFFSEICES